MKIKCKDKLPEKDGSFQTDAGYLDFHKKAYGWHEPESWTICNMLVPAYPEWWDDKQPETDPEIIMKEQTKSETAREERGKLIRGNVLISHYLFGPCLDAVPKYIQIGYTKENTALYREIYDLGGDLPNYHNSFGLLAPAIAKIAKDYSGVDSFTKEEKMCEEVRDAWFSKSYDLKIAWEAVCNYIKFLNEKSYD